MSKEHRGCAFRRAMEELRRLQGRGKLLGGWRPPGRGRLTGRGRLMGG